MTIIKIKKATKTLEKALTTEHSGLVDQVECLTEDEGLLVHASL